MTDDLVKRLRRVSMDLGIPSTTTLESKVVAQAANRIEELYNEWRINADGWSNALVRIEELEAKLKTAEEIGRAFEEDAGQLRAKLAKLEAAAQKAVGHITGYGEASTARIELRTALAELKGEK